MEVNDTRSQYDVPYSVPRPHVFALIENLEPVLNYDAFVTIELVPKIFVDLVGPGPVQFFNAFELLGDVLGIHDVLDVIVC